MPGEQAEPPFSRHCQAAVVDPPSAWSGYGSLNRSKITALLPLKVLATDVQNGTDCAESGIGFWQVALTSEQPAPLPAYIPSVQCRSRMATMPLEFSRPT